MATSIQLKSDVPTIRIFTPSMFDIEMVGGEVAMLYAELAQSEPRHVPPGFGRD